MNGCRFRPQPGLRGYVRHSVAPLPALTVQSDCRSSLSGRLVCVFTSLSYTDPGVASSTAADLRMQLIAQQQHGFRLASQSSHTRGEAEVICPPQATVRPLKQRRLRQQVVNKCSKSSMKFVQYLIHSPGPRSNRQTGQPNTPTPIARSIKRPPSQVTTTVLFISTNFLYNSVNTVTTISSTCAWSCTASTISSLPTFFHFIPALSNRASAIPSAPTSV
jgi:hypothetical protein